MNEQLAAIKARREAITPGVLRVEMHSGILHDGTPSTCAVLTTDEYDLASFGDDLQGYLDATFFAAAPADVDTLLREVERLTGERDALNMWCDEWKRRADELTAELAAERDAAKRHATYIASCVDECGSYRP